MARQITDAQRQVTISLPESRVNWKRLMTWIVLACIVAGLSFGGYYVYNQVTSTAELPSPPLVQPEVVVPTMPTETPAPTVTQTETPAPSQKTPQKLEVEWKNMQAPTSHSISRIIIDQKDEKVIYVAEQLGMAKEILWKFEDEKWLNVGEILAAWKGKVWIDGKEKVLTPEEMKTWTGGGEMLEQISGPTIPEGRNKILSLEEEKYWNNFLNTEIVPPSSPGKRNIEALDGFTMDGNVIFAAILRLEPFNDHRFVFSPDAGNSWYEITVPASFKTREGPSQPRPELAVLSADQQEIRFYVGLEDGTIWQAVLDKMSLP